MRFPTLAAATVAAGLLLAPAAHAAWPGLNGHHVFTYLAPDREDADLWLMEADGSKPRPLLTGPADEAEPSVAPNGRRVAFNSNRGDGAQTQIWTVGVDGRRPRQITRGRRDSYVPSWSPDGDRLLFTRVSGDPEDPQTREAIYVVAARGGRAKPVTRPAPGVRDGFAQFSPDGRRIVFHRAPAPGEPRAIWIVDARGLHPRPLIRMAGRNAQQPNWSPDGRRIAFAGNLDGGKDNEIYVARANGSRLRKLTDDEYLDFGGTFSPDGTKVSHTSCRGGTPENPIGDCASYVIDLETGRQCALAGLPGQEIQADWQARRAHR